MTWKLINRRSAMRDYSHFIFFDGKDVAIADHSIIDLGNPASTEDGLLLFDGKREIKHGVLMRGEDRPIVPVIKGDLSESSVITTWSTVKLIYELRWIL